MIGEVHISMRKTKLMQDVESREQRGNIEQWLPAMVEELGYIGAARELGINKATVERWVLKMGLQTARRVVPVGRGAADLVEKN